MADLQYPSKLTFKTNVITYTWSVTIHVSSVVQVPDCIACIFDWLRHLTINLYFSSPADHGEDVHISLIYNIAAILMLEFSSHDDSTLIFLT